MREADVNIIHVHCSLPGQGKFKAMAFYSGLCLLAQSLSRDVVCLLSGLLLPELEQMLLVTFWRREFRGVWEKGVKGVQVLLIWFSALPRGGSTYWIAKALLCF